MAAFALTKALAYLYSTRTTAWNAKNVLAGCGQRKVPRDVTSNAVVAEHFSGVPAVFTKLQVHAIQTSKRLVNMPMNITLNVRK